jgi:hypothetical protein
MTTAGFWTSTRAHDPAMQYRFRVTITGLADETGADFVWFAKTCDKPKLNNPVLGKDEYFLGSWLPDIKQSEIMDMQPITMVLIDPVEPHLTGILMKKLNTASKSGFPRLDGEALTSIFGTVTVEQMDHSGNPIDKFELVDAFPISVDFGSLDYSSTDFVTVTIVWEYRTIKGFAGVGGPTTGQGDVSAAPMSEATLPAFVETPPPTVQALETADDNDIILRGVD